MLCIVYIAICTGLISLIANIILSGFTARYFDEILIENGLPIPFLLGVSPFESVDRSISYVVYILKRKPRANSRYGKLVGKSFDFRAHARLLDYMTMLSVFLLILSVIIAFVVIAILHSRDLSL